MADIVRLGILGTGNINRRILDGAALSGAVTTAAVASRDVGRARSYAAEHGIRTAYGSYDDLLGDPSIDAVYISLPNTLHHPWTLRALGAGKHVLCEKPYTRRPSEVDEAYDVAEAGRLVLMEAFMWRHSRQASRFLELLPEIGELETIRASFSFKLERPEDIRLRPDLEGGSLMDVGCYCVSGARLLAGQEPERVWGEAINGPTGIDLRFTGTLRFPSGVLAEFSSGFTSPHRSLEAIGTRASLRIADPWLATANVLHLDDRLIPIESVDPYRLELDNFAGAIRGTAKPLLGRDDARGQARALEALHTSGLEGRPVSL